MQRTALRAAVDAECYSRADGSAMKDIEGIDRAFAVLKPHWADIEADFERNNQLFLQLAAANHDQIGRVLRAHLVVEHFLGSFLAAHYGIEDILSIRLTFHQKAQLLPTRGSSASFVRPGILQLNTVRNRLSHELNRGIEWHEISAISEVLTTAREGMKLETPAQAIEAFAPVACAFLTVPPPDIQALFAEAFSHITSYEPENGS